MSNELEKFALKNEITTGIQKIIGSETRVGVFIANKIKVEDFVFLFQKVTELAIKELTPSACKLMLYLLSKCQYQNSVRIHIETIMEDLLLAKSTVIIAMEQLVKIQVVIKVKDMDDKRHNIYYINPVHAWKGRIYKRQRQIREKNKNQLVLPGFNALPIENQ